MTNFIITCILLFPWICLPIEQVAEQFRFPKAVFFDLICLVVIGIAIKEGLKFQYRNKYLAWFLFYAIFTIFFNWYSPILLSTQEKGLQINVWTIEPTLHFILGTFFVLIACSYLERVDFVRIAKAFCVSAMMVSVIGIMQAINVQPFPKVLNFTAGIHVSTLFDNPNLVGNYLCLSVPFFLYINKPKYWVMLAFVLVCTWLTVSDISRAVIVVGAVVYYLLTRQNRKLNIAIGLITIGILVWALFNPEVIRLDDRFAGRFEVWEQGVKFFKANPLWGNGMGIWKTYGILARGVWWYEAHNDWWERLIEFGLVGMFLLSLVISNCIRSFNYHKTNTLGFAYLASFISFLILMGGTFIVETAPIMFWGLICFVACEKLREI